jgi:UDP-2,4-diacetamido-2,4,6-trideoxy-beta-L-altropyranose hydrolase
MTRCLSLADALKARGSRCRFLCRHVPAGLSAVITAHGHELVRLGASAGSESHLTGARAAAFREVSQEQDARESVAACAGNDIDWVVVDHYGLDAVWERTLRELPIQVMAIDDLADRPHECDVLVDQNLYADANTRYRDLTSPQCRLLLGPKYAMLREEFARARDRVGVRSGPVRRILVSFGGVDATNGTAVAVEALRCLQLRDIYVDVVIGAEHPCRDEIVELCKHAGFALHVQSTQMALLMSTADLGIGAGGSSTWERCCVGLPALACAVADNQTRLVHDCALAGALYAVAEPFNAESLSRHVRCLVENPMLRQSISRSGMDLVDGRGTGRVLRALGAGAVHVRPAVLEDARNLFEWRNHPVIREASRSKAPLEWAAHMHWLGTALGDPARMLLIGETTGRPIGVVRFDIAGTVAGVSIYTVPGHEQRGIGADLLAAAEVWMARHMPDVRSINAEVLGDNARSHWLFAGARYERRFTVYAKSI